MYSENNVILPLSGEKLGSQQLTWIWQKDQFCLQHSGSDSGYNVSFWKIHGFEHPDMVVNLRGFYWILLPQKLQDT
jgi:hypothetical protein